MNKLVKLIDVTNNLESVDKPELTEVSQEVPVKKCKKRKLKIPARDLAGMNEDTQHAVFF